MKKPNFNKGENEKQDQLGKKYNSEKNIMPSRPALGEKNNMKFHGLERTVVVFTLSTTNDE